MQFCNTETFASFDVESKDESSVSVDISNEDELVVCGPSDTVLRLDGHPIVIQADDFAGCRVPDDCVAVEGDNVPAMGTRTRGCHGR